MSKYEQLGTPFKIGDLTIKNRFCMAPIGGGQHHLPGGGLKDTTVQYLAERAKGGFGLIFTGAMAADMTVDPYTGVGPSILKDSDAFLLTASELNERVSAYGTKLFAQITMGLGRNYPNLPAPSAVPVFHHQGMLSPELTNDQIKLKIEALVKAAKVAQKAGFNGVEVHSIHWGYLLDQFALSMMNHRTDEYGGCLENRLRAAKEIVEGIKQECGSNFPVSMRLGLKSYVKDFEKATLDGSEEKGRTLEEGIAIAKLLESYGYDCLNTDTGLYDSFYYACPPMYMPKGFAVELAEKVKSSVSIPVLLGGRMNDPDIAVEAIKAKKIDAVVLGRPALADPEYPNKVLTGHTEQIRPCIACNQGCITRLQRGKQPTCAVNPAAMRELRYGLRPCVEKKHVVVVGGGVGGMEAARTAAMRGHHVTLLEKADTLGGCLIQAGSYPFKKEVKELNEWYQRELERWNVDVHTGLEATPEIIKGYHPDTVILACGYTPVMPRLPGIESSSVMDCIEAHEHTEKIGQTVVIVGGGLVGCEIALAYAMKGKNVSVVEALDTLMMAGERSPIPNEQMIYDLFEKYKVTVLSKHKLAEICGDQVVLHSESGEKRMHADNVIIAVGFKPRPSLAAELSKNGMVVYEITGQQIGTILRAVWNGYEIANNI